MPRDVAILSMGMITAVGVSAAETIASVRARTTRFTETNLFDRNFRPFRMAEVPRAAMPPLAASLRDDPTISAREARLLRLASRPLHECVAEFPKSLTLGLCLALPEHETTRALDRSAFLRNLARQTEGAFVPERSDASHRGRAGGLIAVGQAIATIREGVADFVLAGGVDTYRDPYVLGTLDKEQRVQSSLNLDGFIPGEGACFLLLGETRAAAAQTNLRPIAKVSPVAMGFETGHLYSAEPYRGEGLAATLSALAGYPELQAPIASVYSSMNGESVWAKEWGVGYLRSRALFQEEYEMHHPADCFGDTGAAAGPLMLALASRATSEKSRLAPAMVYGSSDHGPRAAIVLTPALH